MEHDILALDGFHPDLEPNWMRALFTSLLVCVLLACPILCRASEDGCCADHEVTSGPIDEHHAPAPSNDSANCICGGAIKSPDSQVHGPDLGTISPPSHTTFLDDLCLHESPLIRGLGSRSLPWEAARLGPGPIHAFIQHFRC
jgi:hypothetical protein